MSLLKHLMPFSLNTPSPRVVNDVEVEEPVEQEPRVEEPKLTPEETARIIEEIHTAFNTEGDRLLEDAQRMVELPDHDKVKLEKSRRLQVIGFGSSRDVEEAKDTEISIANVKEINRQNREDAEVIMYFKNKYPLYKYISEASVKAICKKYGLIYGEVSKFTGFVPEKNLQDIENFKIEDEDKASRLKEYLTEIFYVPREERSITNRFDTGRRERTITLYKYDNFNRVGELVEHTLQYFEKAPLEIAAPMKDFDTEGMKVEGFELTQSDQVRSLPDPVVLQPVWRNNQKHYLIVTAWGDEASDPLVVNEMFN